jgi:hypothetical protein
MTPTEHSSWAVLALLAVLCQVAAGAEKNQADPAPEPATQPATQPAEPQLPARFEDTPDYGVLKATYDVAKARLDAITDDRTRTVTATAEYQSAKKAADEAEAALTKARASGSAEERLAASAAFVKAKTAVDTIRNNAVNQDPDYRATQAALRKADTALKDARSAFDKQRAIQEKAAAAAKAKAAALAAAKDPVRRGQVEGRPAVGMTLAQIQNLYGEGSVVSSTPTSRQLDYVVRERNQIYHVTVTFQNDKVTAWTSKSVIYPTLRFVGDIPQLSKGMSLDELQARLGSDGRAIRESRVAGSAAALLAPPPDKPGPDKPRPKTPADPTETYLQTTYCWKVILETRNGIRHEILTVKLADLQVYDYRLGSSAE